MSDLRKRVSKGFFKATHRYSFYLLLCVTRGESTQLIDFEPVACKAGSLLTVQPAQAHRLNANPHWDGWVALFRPELLLPADAAAGDSVLRIVEGPEFLPQHLWLQEHELRVVTASLRQMQEDSHSAAASEQVRALLRHQMHALLLRLAVLNDHQRVLPNSDDATLRRFRVFKRLVEQRFPQWHGVAEYASRLGCSERSLTRATMAVAGVNAKDFITSRINLEAKRLLAHTSLSVAVIGERLGFQEPTNFVKYFRRGVGCTPGEFRRRQAGGT